MQSERAAAAAADATRKETWAAARRIHHHRGICFPVISLALSVIARAQQGREGGREAEGIFADYSCGVRTYAPTGPSRCVEWRFLRTSSHPPILESALTRHHPKMKLYLPVPTYVWHVDEGATAYNVPACLPFGRRDSGLGIEDCNASLNAFNAIVQSKASVLRRAARCVRHIVRVDAKRGRGSGGSGRRGQLRLMVSLALLGD